MKFKIKFIGGIIHESIYEFDEEESPLFIKKSVLNKTHIYEVQHGNEERDEDGTMVYVGWYKGFEIEL